VNQKRHYICVDFGDENLVAYGPYSLGFCEYGVERLRSQNVAAMLHSTDCDIETAELT
jgi:hypothetical protein